jgi:serine/threonine protein kinase
MVDHYLLNYSELLGIGTYGRVYLGTDVRFDLPVAIKVIQFKNLTINMDKFLGSLRNEIRNMQLVDHENIVKLYDVKKSSNNLYLICEFCNGGSLYGLFERSRGKLPYEEVLRIMWSITAGYKCLHAHGLVHRDIKPANILLHNDTVKMADFGFSKLVEDHHKMDQPMLLSRVGSPQYMAPQILNGERYSSKCDVWSLGMIFYEALFGSHPWTGKDMDSLINQITHKRLEFPAHPRVPEGIKTLLGRMLAINEQDRIPWDQLFTEPLLGELRNENLMETIRALSKSQHVNRLKELMRMYFENNRAIKTIFECERKGRINRVIVNGREEDLSQAPSISENLSQACSVEEIYSRQRRMVSERKLTESVFNYFIGKRNRCAFYSLLTINIIHLCEKIGLCRQISRCVFPLLKLSTRTFYKVFHRLKDNEPEKYINFSRKDWACFDKSGQRKVLTNFVKYDFTVQKLYFDDLLKRLLKVLEVKSRDEGDALENEKLMRLEPILNNKLCEKAVILELLLSNGAELL